MDQTITDIRLERKPPAQNQTASLKPELNHFHDYREFLRLWFQYLKIVESQFSLRSLAQKAGLSAGYLPSFLAGRIGMSPNALGKILPFLQLSTNQRDYLKLLRTIAESESPEERDRSLARLVALRQGLGLPVDNIETYRYMANWYTVAIRELAAIEGFKSDPKWIQSRLRFPVSTSEIQEALAFLFDRGFLVKHSDGSISSQGQKHLECAGGLYRLVLARYHTEIFGLAQQTFHRTERKERAILGHTCNLPLSKMEEIRTLLNQTVNQIKEISNQALRDGGANGEVFQIELACFPLTETKKQTNPIDAEIARDMLLESFQSNKGSE